MNKFLFIILVLAMALSPVSVLLPTQTAFAQSGLEKADTIYTIRPTTGCMNVYKTSSIDVFPEINDQTPIAGATCSDGTPLGVFKRVGRWLIVSPAGSDGMYNYIDWTVGGNGWTWVGPEMPDKIYYVTPTQKAGCMTVYKTSSIDSFPEINDQTPKAGAVCHGQAIGVFKRVGKWLIVSPAGPDGMYNYIDFQVGGGEGWEWTTASLASRDPHFYENQDPEVWSCGNATESNKEVHNQYKKEWGQSIGYAAWLNEKGCLDNWPKEWISATELQKKIDGQKNDLANWLIQQGINSSFTLGDLAWEQLTGSPVCRNPRQATQEDIPNVDFDDLPQGTQITLCGWTPTGNEANASLAMDAGFLTTTIIGTPGFPVDDIVAVLKTGRDIILVVATMEAAKWLQQQGAVLRYHSDPQHDPYLKGSAARVIIPLMIAFINNVINGGPQNNRDRVRCYLLQVAGKAIRTITWIADKVGSSTGSFAVFDLRSGEYVTAFTNKDIASLRNVGEQYASDPTAKVVGDGSCTDPMNPLGPAVR